MANRFDVEVDRQRRLLVFSVEGLFTPEEVTGIAAAKLDALSRLGGDPSDHVSIVDVSRCNIQMQDVANALAAIMRDRRYAARRIAFVTNDSSLARMQIRRMAHGIETVRLCSTTSEAESWLFA